MSDEICKNHFVVIRVYTSIVFELKFSPKKLSAIL